MNKKILSLAALGLAVCLLAGCRIRFNLNKTEPDPETLLAESELEAEPVAYDPEGAYTLTFRYAPGGFARMDLSRAYVAYYPITVLDQVDAIVGEDDGEIPPLPVDAQNAVNEAVGAGELQKIAVVTIETVDDNTLRVSFTDRDDPVQGKEYFFVIPNEELTGSVIPD